MKRSFDLFFGVMLLLFFAVPMLFIFIAVRLTSKGPAIYCSYRVGKNNKIYKMPKFRSMLIDTPVVATHLLGDSSSYLSSIGGFLRRSSLDELPQLLSVLKGDMSFVGPRPALFNPLLRLVQQPQPGGSQSDCFAAFSLNPRLMCPINCIG